MIVLNTHWDHRGSEARSQSGNLIQKKIEELSLNQQIPIILAGDLNEDPKAKGNNF